MLGENSSLPSLLLGFHQQSHHLGWSGWKQLVKEGEGEAAWLMLKSKRASGQVRSLDCDYLSPSESLMLTLMSHGYSKVAQDLKS